MSLSLFKSFSLVAKNRSFIPTGRTLSLSAVGKRSFSSSTPTHSTSHNVATATGSHGHHAPAKTAANTQVITKEEPHLFPYEDGDYVPPTETHAVGDEKEEIDLGPWESTVLSGGFGTEKSPIEVPSRYPSRIVGCTGSATEDHELLWHEVKLGKDLICMDCGQFFRLTTIPGFEETAHGHGHHGHGHEHEEEFSGHKDGDGFRFMYPPKTQAQLAKEKAERDEELKKDPKAPVKKTKAVGVDYHQYGEQHEQGRLANQAPVFQDLRPQTYKDRK